MLKKILLAIALVALLSVSLSAGEIKVEAPWEGTWTWTAEPVAIGNVVIPVWMDINYWVEIVNQEDLMADGIKLTQVTIHHYTGCAPVEVLANFDAELDVIITPVQGFIGDLTATISPPDVYALQQSTHHLCVDADNVDLAMQMANTEMHIADCVITIVPVGLAQPG